MKNRYNRIAEKIKVTPEMSDRILKNISEMDLKEKNISYSIKTTFFRKILALAACFVMIVCCVTYLPNILSPPVEPPVQVIPDIVEYENLSELCNNVDFDLMLPTILPENMTATSYSYYFKEIAQIVYSDGENEIVYRTAKGSDDISGDYNNYSIIKEVEIGNNVVTIKGDEKGYQLAVWIDREYIFAMSSNRHLSEDEFLKIISSMEFYR